MQILKNKNLSTIKLLLATTWWQQIKNKQFPIFVWTFTFSRQIMTCYLYRKFHCFLYVYHAVYKKKKKRIKYFNQKSFDFYFKITSRLHLFITFLTFFWKTLLKLNNKNRNKLFFYSIGINRHHLFFTHVYINELDHFCRSPQRIKYCKKLKALYFLNLSAYFF